MNSQRFLERILVVGPSWVGDMVMAQSLFKLLTIRHTRPAIDVLAPAWSLPILERMPEVRQGLEMPVGHGQFRLAERWRLGRRLKETNYDQALVLPNSLKSALIPWFAGIPKRTGWRGEMRYGLLNDLRVLDKARYPLMVQRFNALALDPGAELPKETPLPALQVDSARARALLQQFGLADSGSRLGLCPGAEFGPAKRWPIEHYAALAARYIERGWQVVVFGSGNDRPVANAIQSALPPGMQAHCASLAGETTLTDSVDLLSTMDAVVSNDSGLMHIVAALQKPLVACYGSTSPEFTPPLSDSVRTLQIPVDCGPCFKRECPLGHLKCLYGIEPGTVSNAVDDLLAKQGSS